MIIPLNQRGHRTKMKAGPLFVLLFLFVGSIPAAAIDLPVSKQYLFDFGSTSSPLAPGAIAVTPQTSGDIAWDGPLGASDRGTDPLTGDLVATTAPRECSISLPRDGIWIATFFVGDIWPVEGVVIKAEGLPIQNVPISVAAGETKRISAGVLVRDGVLNLAFENETPNQYWSISALSLRDPEAIVQGTQTTFHYDFGPEWESAAPGFDRISPATTGDIRWSGAVDRSVDATDPSQPDATSVGRGNPRTLSHKIANGTWRVTLGLGRMDGKSHQTSVFAEENTLFQNIATSPGVVVSRQAIVTVDDGELNLTFDANGHASGWGLTQLSLESVAAAPPATGQSIPQQPSRGTLVLSGEPQAKASYGVASTLRYADGDPVGRYNFFVESGKTHYVSRGGERYGWRVYENNLSEITAETARTGNHAVAVETRPTSEEAQGDRKQRLEYTLGDWAWADEEAEGAYGFSLKLDPAKWDSPTDWFLISQLNQSGTEHLQHFHQTGALYLSPQNLLYGSCMFGNNQGGQPGLGNRRITFIDAETLRRGIWYDIVVEWRIDTKGIVVDDLSSSAGDGFFRIYIKQADETVYRMYGKERTPFGYKDTGRHADFTLGIYKGATETSHRIFLDNVRYGTNFMETAPEVVGVEGRINVTALRRQGILQWPSLQGQTYTIEACDDLADDTWLPLQSITANATSSEVVLPSMAHRQHRFFRMHWTR